MKTRSTTILTIRHNGQVAMGGDGQVSMGQTVVKSDAMKIRRLMDNRVLVGFAGTAADAFALMERLETKLKDYPANLPRAATELAKEWRTDRALRRLEALVAVVNSEHTLLVLGDGRCHSAQRRHPRHRARVAIMLCLPRGHWLLIVPSRQQKLYESLWKSPLIFAYTPTTTS